MKIQAFKQLSRSSIEKFTHREFSACFFSGGIVFRKRDDFIPMNNKEASDEYYD